MSSKSKAPRPPDPAAAISAESGTGERWLLLVFQLPAKPAYLRVKVWRRLQALGAVAVKNAAYALPATAEAQEDFGWLAKEITEAGGEPLVCEARLVEGMTDADVRALFDRARDADYEALAEEARQLAAEAEEAGKAGEAPGSDARSRLSRLRSRLDQVAAIDFFGAHGRQAVEGLLASLTARLAAQDEAQAAPPPQATAAPAEALRGLIWVTRAGVHVDRIASAWLVRRFIDPEARFRFVPGKAAELGPGEVRFDMAEAEVTHEGDRCTFEVLLGRAGLSGDRALAAVAEIVHDIDLKDGKFGRPEADGVRTLIGGLCAATSDDEERLRRGAEIFDDLHRYFDRPPRGR
ncbi:MULTISPECIES: chromate resistance protein ChrB domain-containing protein [Roseicella]|uniref:Chromate resistance protein n=2 Tax=Roseicella TaxID=2730923 RepID=A0A9X1LCK6_9PROT|nr:MULTISPECIES: chromate resistance protein ChrB domain-containing protein [Roseicella]MCB4824213.1 chromate resistance protein [Roseicella aerolata]RAI56060.1 ChrB protein [Roseicella frigidaeris]